jgi:hypothetical protein
MEYVSTGLGSVPQDYDPEQYRPRRVSAGYGAKSMPSARKHYLNDLNEVF